MLTYSYWDTPVLIRGAAPVEEEHEVGEKVGDDAVPRNKPDTP